MLAIRKVLEVKNNAIHFELPPEFNNTKVEVLVYDIQSNSGTGKAPSDLKFGGSLPYAIGEDIESELRNLVSEWEMPAF